jgi:hypothetical protein
MRQNTGSKVAAETRAVKWRFVRAPDLRHFVLDSHFKRSKSDKACYVNRKYRTKLKAPKSLAPRKS